MISSGSDSDDANGKSAVLDYLFRTSLKALTAAAIMRLKLNGEQALAYGALDAGVSMVTSYPGSPSSGAVQTLIPEADRHGIYVEWSSNEKVAVEMAIGASMAGGRALVCAKSVGMNLMIDPLMALNLTPVHGGLVILVGDDPGAYGSQNDQDTRSLAVLLEMPLMEPASPAEAYEMIQTAFTVSEELQTAVLIRETRNFSQRVEIFEASRAPYRRRKLPLNREPWRFVPVPENAVQKHRDLHRRYDRLRSWANRQPFNSIEGRGPFGVIAAGFVFNKLMDVLEGELPENIRVLKIGNLSPLPERLIVNFFDLCEAVLVLEEIEPFVEQQVKAIAQEHGCVVRVFGKATGHSPREGEIFHWHIYEALRRFLPEFTTSTPFPRRHEARERPNLRDHCAECRYEEIIDAIEEAARRLRTKPILIGDPGCLVKVGGRLDGKFAMGSAVGVADGISKIDDAERVVALLGDSSFFHTTIPAICNAVHNDSNILIIVLDNESTATSGFQPNPGVDRNALGKPAPRLSIGGIAKACGIKTINVVDLDDPEQALGDHLVRALAGRRLSMIIIRIPPN